MSLAAVLNFSCFERCNVGKIICNARCCSDGDNVDNSITPDMGEIQMVILPSETEVIDNSLTHVDIENSRMFTFFQNDEKEIVIVMEHNPDSDIPNGGRLAREVLPEHFQKLVKYMEDTMRNGDFYQITVSIARNGLVPKMIRTFPVYDGDKIICGMLWITNLPKEYDDYTDYNGGPHLQDMVDMNNFVRKRKSSTL